MTLFDGQTYIEMLDLLFDNGYQIDDLSSSISLDNIVKSGKIELLGYLFDKGFNVESIYNNFSLLESACLWRNAEAVKCLLAHGADPNGKDVAGEPLENAVEEGSYDIVKLLIDYGADVNTIPTYSDGSMADSPLMIAARKGYYDIVKILLDNGAQIVYESKKAATSPLSFMPPRVKISWHCFWIRRLMLITRLISG
ncbi:hypothetical protein SDC9_53925 [bioreactor metagenome]|uniref:Uncharacterized protein n=1 Tax=bioreactor metagenome TaxID=1076179 RepID=A0A644WV24_9ZZZZ